MEREVVETVCVDNCFAKISCESQSNIGNSVQVTVKSKRDFVRFFFLMEKGYLCKFQRNS